MRNHPSRSVSVAAAFAATLWAFLLLPPQQSAWSGADIPPWLGALDRMPLYDGIRLWLQAIGQQDFYLAFGAAASVSFVLVWFATGPILAEFGRLGRVLGALVLLTAPITALSYLNHPQDAPLHGLWGAEAFMLIFIGVLALVVAIFARRGSGVPVWERVLLGLTLPILVASTFLFTYWPHGTLVGFGLQAAALAAWGKRAPSTEPSPAGAALRAA
jgi:hypothetical protein